MMPSKNDWTKLQQTDCSASCHYYNSRRYPPYASNALCHSLALTTTCLCSVLVDPSCITPLLACCLIAFDKNPGVRSIGVGETCQHLIAKPALTVTRSDTLEATGLTQLCAGQVAGAEAAIHVSNRMELMQCFLSMSVMSSVHSIETVLYTTFALTVQPSLPFSSIPSGIHPIFSLMVKSSPPRRE